MPYPDLSGIFSTPRMPLVRDSLHGSKAERIMHERSDRQEEGYRAGMVAQERQDRSAKDPDKSGRTR